MALLLQAKTLILNILKFSGIILSHWGRRLSEFLNGDPSRLNVFFHTYDVNPNSCVDFSCPVFSTAFILANIFESNIVDG